MGTARSTLLIWLIIVQSKPMNSMDEAPKAIPSQESLRNKRASVLITPEGKVIIPLKDCVFPSLCSENAIKTKVKNAYREGYQQGLKDSKIIVDNLEKMLQETNERMESTATNSQHLANKLADLDQQLQSGLQRMQITKVHNQHLTEKLAAIEPKQLELEKITMKAREELANLMAQISPHQTTFTKLQDILALLNQACELPKK